MNINACAPVKPAGINKIATYIFKATPLTLLKLIRNKVGGPWALTHFFNINNVYIDLSYCLKCSCSNIATKIISFAFMCIHK